MISGLDEASLHYIRWLRVVQSPKFICQNPACRSEIELVELSPKAHLEKNANLLCRCGSEMKKVYFDGPHLRELTPEQAARYFIDD